MNKHLFARLLFVGLSVCSISIQSQDKEEVLSLAKKGLLDSAYSVGLKALKLPPPDPELILLMAKLEPKGTESIQYLNKVTSTKKRNSERGTEYSESMYRSGQYYYAKGNYKKSMEYFAPLTRSKAHLWYTQSKYWLAECYLSLSASNPIYVDSAQKQFNSLINDKELNPFYYPATAIGLAKTYLLKNKTAKGLEIAEAALAKTPAHQLTQVYYSLYSLSANLNDSSGLQKYAALLLKKFPASPEAKLVNEKDRRIVQKQNDMEESETVDASISSTVIQDSLSKKTAGEKENNLPLKANIEEKTGGKYALQVGAFSTPENANAKKIDLQNMGIATYLSIKKSGTQSIYLLQTETFSSKAEALDFGEKKLKAKQISYYPVSK